MVTLQQIKPLEIEKESFRIIESEFLEQTGHYADEYEAGRFKILRRVIHATGDFSFAATLTFHEQAIQAGIASIRAGRNILIDVNMGAAGISRSILKQFGGEVICRIADSEVGRIAQAKGLTRSEVGLDLAIGDNIGIVAIGNAPTALLAAMQLIEAGKFAPDLVVGVPVGFVNAQESKEILADKTYPFITALGRKGGTPVAVAIINALLRLAEEG
jgi:precorrin-8X/cobalt-precorrin-8 methylmutase